MNKKMRIARIEHDLSQEQLAEAVGVTRQTVSLIESEKYNPSLHLCVAICKALNKNPERLILGGMKMEITKSEENRA